MRKTIDPKVRNVCRLWVRVEYRDKTIKPATQWIKWYSYKSSLRRAGNTFMDRKYGPFVIKKIEPLPYGPELPA